MKLVDMTWPDVERAAQNTVAVLPLGAIEQHGRHLAVSVDSAIVTSIAEAVERELPESIVLCPAQYYGASHHHLGFPGTMSISVETFTTVLVDLVESLLSGGFRRIVLLNGHAGNAGPAEQALRAIAERAHARDARPEPNIALATYWELAGDAFRGSPPMSSPALRHACEYETSLMLYLHPHRVFSEALESARHAPANEYICWNARAPFRGVAMHKPMHCLTNTGSMGNPEMATAVKGQHLNECAVNAAVDFLRSFHTWPLMQDMRPVEAADGLR